MNLSHLTDEVLLTDTKKLSAGERQFTVLVLHHIAEIDRRKLYTDLKYGSLYEYCIKELKYSEASAHGRVVASRLMAQIPDIEPRIQKGNITLSNLMIVSRFMKNNNIVNIHQKKEIIGKIENLSKRECENKLLEITGRTKPKVTTITIMDETYVLLQKTRDMMGGYLSNDELITKIAQNEIKKIEKERFKQTDRQHNATQPVEAIRVISAETKRMKYSESPHCENCGSITDLEFDHRIPKSLGGTNDPENIRILCRNCNERSRIRAGL